MLDEEEIDSLAVLEEKDDDREELGVDGALAVGLSLLPLSLGRWHIAQQPRTDIFVDSCLCFVEYFEVSDLSVSYDD